MYSFLFNIVKCINIKIYIIIKIVILSMSDIKISGINMVFKPLEKSGYSIYFNSSDNENKIIYKKNDNIDDTAIIITNSSIFNTIYSHEINENDVPLVEYYNLLIETISQEPQVVSQSVINYSHPQVQAPIYIPQNSTAPLQITNGQVYNSFDYNATPQSFTPLQITNGQGSQRSQEFEYTSPLANNQQTTTEIKKTTVIFENIKTIFSRITKLFSGNKKLKNLEIILGTHVSKKNKHLNIKTEYQSRYPPKYKGPYFKIHAINDTAENLTDNIDDIDTIRDIAMAWNNYIANIITNKQLNLDEYEKCEKKLHELFTPLSTNYAFIYFFSNTIRDPSNNNLPFDRYREFSTTKYAMSENIIYQYVNIYGYPIYRAYFKNIELFSKYLKNNTIQITDGQAGGAMGMNGEQLNSEADWQQYALQYGNISPINTPQISSQGASGFNGLQNFSSINPIVTPSPITNKYAWNYNDGKITRYNGYYDMEYNRTKKDIFYYNENKNIYIKFYIFSVEDINDTSNPVTIIIVKTSEYKIEPIIVTSSEKFLIDNIEKLENKIIAKISTNTDIGGNTYILFNVDIIENIKEAYIYKEEDKYKYDFVNLNNDLKKIIEYYNTINGLTYFRTYGELEKKLKEFKNTYDLNDNNVNNVENLIKIYKEELKLRSNICNAILDKSVNNNINKYKDLLEYTYNNIDNYPDKKDYTSRIYKLINQLIDRVRYYGENFIY